MTKKGLSGSTLKWIAVVTMLIDHFAAVFYVGGRLAGKPPFSYESYLLLRFIGRLAFPIYGFLLAEGFRHTHSVKRYLLRLFLFGLVSEVPFDLAFRRSWFDPSHQNVFFTLFLGLLAVWLWTLATRGDPDQRGAGRVLLGLLGIGAATVAAQYGHTDYGAWGVLVIVSMALFGKSEWQRNLFSGCFLLGSSALEITALLDFVLFHFYSGRRGRQPKYFFYLFYPLHLLILALLCRVLYGG
jgi:hypothetical protein